MDNIKKKNQKPKITVPKGYNFEAREKTKIKSISQQKFEDDITRREQEVDALRN